MAQTSRPVSGAAAFVTVLFGLPFFCIGAGVLVLEFIGAQKSSPAPGAMIAVAVIPCIFMLVGGLMIYGAVSGYRKGKTLALLRQQNPSSPWLWREDWAAGRANSDHQGDLFDLWMLAAIVAMFVSAATAAMLPRLLQQHSPMIIILGVFCLVAVLFIVLAVRASRARERFGKTYFAADNFLFSPGGELAGQICLRTAPEAQHGVTLTLRCAGCVIKGVGKNRRTIETTLWESSQNVPALTLGTSGVGASIPVQFKIPEDAQETSRKEYRNERILWRLHAEADAPGIDFSDDFEIPVFRPEPLPEYEEEDDEDEDEEENAANKQSN